MAHGTALKALPFKTCRVIVKLGTGILTSGIGKLNTDRIADICRQIHLLRQQNVRVILVSSGAVGLGMGKLGLDKRPTDLARLQACAAVGQGILIQTWQRYFEQYGITVAQLLLTRDDLRARKRHLAARSTFERLLDDDIVPIVNENDPVSAEEIKPHPVADDNDSPAAARAFGDNDVLSSMVASLVRADYLLILSTAPGLLDLQGDKRVIPVVEKVDAEVMKLAGGTTSVTAVGGMVTKLDAARIANRSGCGVFIASGSEADVVQKIFSGNNPGTFFVPSGAPLESKKRWLAFFEHPKGTLRIDEGAAQALVEHGSSLLAKGIASIKGRFQAGEIIDVAGPEGQLVARGVAQFSSEELSRIARKDMSEIKTLFPGRKRLEAIHRNSMVMLGDR
jgi:glutamate 5-kinase